MFYLILSLLISVLIVVLYISTFVPLKRIKKSFLQDYDQTIRIINASGNWELHRTFSGFGYLINLRAEEFWLCHRGTRSANYDLRLLAKELKTK